MRPIEKLPAVEAVTPQAGPHRDATIEDEMSELDIDKYHNFSREAAEEETIEAAIRVARRPIQRNARKARRWRLERRTAPLNRIVQPDGDTQYWVYFRKRFSFEKKCIVCATLDKYVSTKKNPKNQKNRKTWKTLKNLKNFEKLEKHEKPKYRKQQNTKTHKRKQQNIFKTTPFSH